MQYVYTNGIALDESAIINQVQGSQGWYEYVNIYYSVSKYYFSTTHLRMTQKQVNIPDNSSTFEQTIVIAPNIINCTEDKNETTIDGTVSNETVQNKEYGFMKVLNVWYYHWNQNISYAQGQEVLFNHHYDSKLILIVAYYC